MHNIKTVCISKKAPVKFAENQDFLQFFTLKFAKSVKNLIS